MKLNFIQNLSDEVVRQNHQLKTRLHQVKQQLNDFQNQMVELIMSIADRKPIGLTPSEVLQEFVKVINAELSHHRSLKMHSTKLQKAYEQSQKEQIRYQRIVSQKTIQLDTLSKLYQQQLTRNTKKQQQRKLQIQTLQTENRRVMMEMQQLKLQKLKLQQQKRREIEDIRQYHNHQFLTFRQKSEKDHLRKEKQLNKQLSQKQKTIKQMTKAISQLSTSKALENPAAAAEIFKTFNNFEQLTKINKEVKQQNQQLRKQVSQLYRKIISLEAQLQTIKSVQYNLVSQLQRMLIEKQEIENKLLEKTNQIHKSEKDKEVMERYYDQKWNSEYKKVKVKLEKAFNLKVTELEESYKLRLINIEIELKNAQEQQENLKRRNEQLERRHCHDGKVIQELKNSGSQLIIQLRESRSQTRQLNSMFFEQILILKGIFAEQKQASLQIITNKQKQIDQSAKKLAQQQLQNKLKIQSLQQTHKQNLLHQQQKFLSQKNLSSHQFNAQLSALQKQISSKIDFSNRIRRATQQQYQSKIDMIERSHALQIQEKQKQLMDNNNRWIDKHQELQSLLVINRKRYEEEITKARQEIKQFIEKQYKLYREIEFLKEKIEKEEALMAEINNEIEKKEQQIAQRDNANHLLQAELAKSKKEVEILFANRKQWSNQVLQLQRQYYSDFNELKKQNEKQISIYKAKINELQNLTRRKIVNKKQWDKINQMRKQRQSISSQIHIKQAQNIILHQIKDYYKTKLKQSEGQLGASQFKNQHAILARKLKKNRIQSNQSTSHRVFQPKSQFVEKARYAINSVSKNYHLSLSKSRFKDNSSKKMHLQTVSSLK